VELCRGMKQEQKVEESPRKKHCENTTKSRNVRKKK
jgi:hypothetical protein